jgi:hypothetical protein
VPGDGCTYGLAHAARSVIAVRGRYRQIKLEKMDSSVFL